MTAYEAEINGVQVLSNKDISDAEALEYVHMYKEKKPGLYKLTIHYMDEGRTVVIKENEE